MNVFQRFLLNPVYTSSAMADPDDFGAPKDDPETWSLPTVLGVRTSERSKRISVSRPRGGSLGIGSVGSVNTEEIEEIEAELLRGVSLSTALNGLGKHWKLPSLTSMYEIQEKSAYKLSFEVAAFHHFLSHDWKTSRWAKYWSILILFNLRAATIATFLAAILVGLYIGPQPVPVSLHSLSMVAARFLPWLVFVFFLCFWQSLRSVSRRPLVVFLDKLCIAQHDPALKAKGIRGLSTFLDRSEQLTILWSSRYFTRLWCVYELATFLRHGQAQQVQLFPVAMARVLLVIASSSVPARILADFNYILGSSDIFAAVIQFAYILLVQPLILYLLLGVMADVQSLEKQFKEFSIQKSHCFCCTSDHRHPDTGETLMCDRKFVYEAVRTWYPAGNADGDSIHFQKFDEVVRTRLRSSVLEGAETVILPFKIMFCLAVVNQAPAVVQMMTWSEADMVRYGVSPVSETSFARSFWRVIAWISFVWVKQLVFILVDAGFLFRICKWSSRLLLRMSRLKATLLVSPLLVLISFTYITAIAASYGDFIVPFHIMFEWLPVVTAGWWLFISWLYRVGPFS
eukprot:s70_g16.t1